MDQNPKPEIAISVTEGRTIRDLFYNGLLDYLIDSGFTVSIFTEAIFVSDFIREWDRPGVKFYKLFPSTSSKSRSRSLRIRRALAKLGIPFLLNNWLRFEEKQIYKPPVDYLDYFRLNKPSLLMTTHAHLPNEAELISAAHKFGIKTLGIVRSWDNVYKGILSRPQKMAVWNEINLNELVKFEGYKKEDIFIVGAPQFDQYFDSRNIMKKLEFFNQRNLDPQRPLITFATLGYFIPGYDETCWMDVLEDLITTKQIPGNPQVICRLHPWSRLEHFKKYERNPDISLSYVDKYWPALSWYMNKEDMVEMANILNHSNIVITPASTITLEAAIFDKPTIVPIFHPYQPERAKQYFSTWVLGKHFGRIAHNKMVPIIDQIEDFKGAIIKGLKEPDWGREKRSQLVDEYVKFVDGKSTKRIADLAIQLSNKKGNVT